MVPFGTAHVYISLVPIKFNCIGFCTTAAITLGHREDGHHGCQRK